MPISKVLEKQEEVDRTLRKLAHDITLQHNKDMSKFRVVADECGFREKHSNGHLCLKVHIPNGVTCEASNCPYMEEYWLPRG